tara:strand:- start:309 stop:716 length:408 start_codon:yes stop_codon:yes gene_type:complete
MNEYEKLKEIYVRNDNIDEFNIFIENEINYIKRQTDYTDEIALNKLKQFDMNKELILKDFIGIEFTKQNKTTNKTTNQKMFNEFRSFLDDASNIYYEKKKNDEKNENQIIDEKNENQIIDEDNENQIIDEDNGIN